MAPNAKTPITADEVEQLSELVTDLAWRIEHAGLSLRGQLSVASALLTETAKRHQIAPAQVIEFVRRAQAGEAPKADPALQQELAVRQMLADAGVSPLLPDQQAAATRLTSRFIRLLKDVVPGVCEVKVSFGFTLDGAPAAPPQTPSKPPEAT